MLDRADLTVESSAIQVLTDYDAVRLAEQLGMFTSTQAMRLRQVLEMMAFFAEPLQEEDEESDRVIAPEEAVRCLRACVEGVLGQERLETALEFAKFRESIQERTFTESDPEIQSLLASPPFFQRTTLRVLLAAAKTTHGAQLEHCLANVNVIIPAMWTHLLKSDRWTVGRAYSEIYNEGRTIAAAGLRKALLKVQGFDYVPENLRSRSFIETAQKLIRIHFEPNNFYNEPTAIRSLLSLGTVIPIPAFAVCASAILCVCLGNEWGTSWDAQSDANSLLSKFGESRWNYYLDECLPGDEVILEKLMKSSIAPRWSEVVIANSLANIDLKKKDTRDIVQAAYKKRSSQVNSLATKMFKHLTGNN